MISTNSLERGVRVLSSWHLWSHMYRGQCLKGWFCSHVNRKEIKLLKWMVMIAVHFFCSESCIQETDYKIDGDFFLQLRLASDFPTGFCWSIQVTEKQWIWQADSTWPFLANGFSHTVVLLPSTDRSGSHSTVWNLVCEKY